MDSFTGGGGRSFEASHLASFDATIPSPDSRGSGPRLGGGGSTLMTAVEAVRRLRQLVARRAIWSTRVTIGVGSTELLVRDAETSSVMERFPLSLVYRPTAVPSDSSDGLCDNVVILLVLGDPQQQLPPEVHIFQCTKRPADELVEVILAAKSKKSAPPSSAQREVEAAIWPERTLQYEEAAKRTAHAVKAYKRNRQQNEAHTVNNSSNNNRIVKSVEILNKCFDDIEQFMLRLQSVADAYKELEKRRKGRKKKTPQHGDGMLSIRARNPPDKDIVEVLQKFKVSFNLLARLKSHIHDPNSPELVHFLFTPLSLIIEASRDPNLSTDLPSKVVSPLLSASAVSLLHNCLTSMEIKLWQSLGTAWINSRESWTGRVPSYQLRFLDGYEPERIYWDDDDVTEATRSPQHQYLTTCDMNDRAPSHKEPVRMYDRRPSQDEVYQSSQYMNTQRPPPAHEDLVDREHQSTLVRRGQDLDRGSQNTLVRPREDFNRERQATLQRAEVDGGQGRQYWDRSPPGPAYNHPASHRMHTMASGMQPASQGMQPASQGIHGTSAMMRDYGAQERFLCEIQQHSSRVFQVMGGHEGRNQHELTVMKGDILEVSRDPEQTLFELAVGLHACGLFLCSAEVLDGSRNWWKVRNYRGQVGHVPYTLLQPYAPTHRHTP